MMIRGFLLMLALLLPLSAEAPKVESFGKFIAGKEELTDADLEGKLLVIHYWQAHCGACKQALPGFQKEMRSKKSYSVAMVQHWSDKEELAVEVADDLKLKVPVYHNSKAPAIKAKTWPCVVILSPDGKELYNGKPGDAFEDALKDAKKSLKK